uniref:Uncharacterized protein n=1 Tax=Rhizophora mucronata TaxID=61149 RepID=A0A2P2MX11_RHIMU
MIIDLRISQLGWLLSLFFSDLIFLPKISLSYVGQPNPTPTPNLSSFRLSVDCRPR